MTRKQSVLSTMLLMLLMAPGAARAQQLWSGIISPSRAVNWSNAGISGGVPARTAVCATLNPGATAAQINSAIASCPAGQVVYLNAGTYSLSGMIDFAGHNNVTLRGAGPDQTIVQFSAGGSCNGPYADVCIEGSFNWNGGPQNLTSWTGGYSAGSTQITLSSTSGLSVGQILILDQANDLLDTGGVFVCDNATADAQHTGCDDGGNSGSPGRNVNGVDYNQQQYVQVTGISGNTVTISPGLYMPNWRSSQTPGAWWANSVITGSGIEGMTLDHTNSNETSGTMFWNAYECWMKNVKSIRGNRNHVWIQYSAKIVVRDSYFWGTLNASALSYGVEPWQSGDLLVENNIFQMITTPILIGNTSGSVFGYNFSTNDYYTNATWQMPGPGWSHDAGTGMNLLEGNEGTGLMEDAIHGSHNFTTAFRNGFSGKEPSKTQQTVPIILMSHTRYDNLIGNVLGTPGYHNTYQSNEPTSNNCDTSIYNLGWGSSECSSDPTVPNDPLVASTLMRWGNYDTVNQAAQWNASEVPSGLSQFSNPVPGSQSLPTSFYQNSKPSWWGTMPWPAIGPDVTGAPDVTGHANAIPAEVCYNSTAVDSNGILIFNANNCYGSSSTPTPTAPTNLTANVN